MRIVCWLWPKDPSVTDGRSSRDPWGLLALWRPEIPSPSHAAEGS